MLPWDQYSGLAWILLAWLSSCKKRQQCYKPLTTKHLCTLHSCVDQVQVTVGQTEKKVTPKLSVNKGKV